MLTLRSLLWKLKHIDICDNYKTIINWIGDWKLMKDQSHYLLLLQKRIMISFKIQKTIKYVSSIALGLIVQRPCSFEPLSFPIFYQLNLWSFIVNQSELFNLIALFLRFANVSISMETLNISLNRVKIIDFIIANKDENSKCCFTIVISNWSKCIFAAKNVTMTVRSENWIYSESFSSRNHQF